MTDDEIPLDITGHEDRDRPSEKSNGDDEEVEELSLLDGSSSDGPDPSSNGESPGAEAGTDTDGSAADDVESGDDDESEEKTVEEKVEPVEVLVQLAKDGEIDPWDIDIVDVTDKFLDRIDEADLRTSGRALFYASVLLRMKGDAMLSEGEDEPEEPEPWEQALAGQEPLEDPDPFAALEQEMDRRLERKRARGMPQTLDELVRDLREAERENWWKHSREYDTSDSPESYRQGTQELDYRSADQFRVDDEPTEDDVTGTTHGEDVDVIINDVYRALLEHYDQGRKEVLFREIDTAAGSRVTTFLGLLFLSHRGQVRLRQDELFGDLWIQDPSAVTGSGEAVAD